LVMLIEKRHIELRNLWVARNQKTPPGVLVEIPSAFPYVLGCVEKIVVSERIGLKSELRRDVPPETILYIVAMGEPGTNGRKVHIAVSRDVRLIRRVPWKEVVDSPLQSCPSWSNMHGNVERAESGNEKVRVDVAFTFVDAKNVFIVVNRISPDAAPLRNAGIICVLPIDVAPSSVAHSFD